MQKVDPAHETAPNAGLLAGKPAGAMLLGALQEDPSQTVNPPATLARQYVALGQARGGGAWPCGFAATLTGFVQVVPLKVVALPSVSMTAQNAELAQAIERYSRLDVLPAFTAAVLAAAAGSIVVGSLHLEPSHVNA